MPKCRSIISPPKPRLRSVVDEALAVSHPRARGVVRGERRTAPRRGGVERPGSIHSSPRARIDPRSLRGSPSSAPLVGFHRGRLRGARATTHGLKRALTALAGAAGIVVALLAPPPGSASGRADPRATVLDIEWRIPTGYERCAAVVTARRPGGLEAKTAGHCANAAFSLGRFFDGYTIYGSAIHVIRRSGTSDSATLFVAVDAAHARRTPVAVPAPRPPALETTVTIVAIRSRRCALREYEVYCSRCGPGDSGSGLFDVEGRLVGLVYGVTEIEYAAGGRLPDGSYANVIPVAALR